MSFPRPRAIASHFQLYWSAYLLLLCSLGITFGLYTWSTAEIHQRQETTFQHAKNKFRQVMDIQFSSYLNILTGLKAFCLQRPDLTPAEFNRYFDSLGMRRDHLGIFDVGYIARVPAIRRSAVNSKAIQYGITQEYGVKFPNDTDDHYVLLFWDDFSPKPQVAYGSHLFDDPERLSALNKARDMNQIVSTERLTIHLGLDRAATNGFIVYLPVYARNASIEAVEERREALIGFVFASLFIPDTWGKIYSTASEPLIDFEVYDGPAPLKEKLWFDSDRTTRMAQDAPPASEPRFKSSQQLNVMGRTWTICFSSRPEFETTPELRIPDLMLGAGCFLSSVLFILFLAQIRARVRTETLATKLSSLSQTLKQEKERLSVTLSSISEGLITVDAQGHVILMNRVAEEQSECQSSDAIGQPLEELLQIEDPQSGEIVPWPVEEILRTGNVWQTPKTVRLSVPNGASILVVITGSPMRNPAGNIDGVVVAIRDVTERQKLLEEQIKSTKLESIGVLAGGIAHDFNNILTTIMGNVSMAVLETQDHSEASRFLKEASLGCERARDLTQQLLTFAKGGAPIRKTAILTDVIRDSARFATHGSTVRCVYELAPDMWPVEADKGQISQVIHNIVLNATQAMPGGGIIRIFGDNLRFDADIAADFGLPPGRYVTISIQDQGTGIHPDNLQKIFDPYFSTKQRGNGLGLATAYSIIRRHDGLITVNSKLGEGTQFDIYLPASNKRAKNTSTQEKIKLVPRRGRILIMDDEQPVLNLLSYMLMKLGYEVITATDGAQAIALYSQAMHNGQSISAVIFDLTVPGGIGGQQAIAQLLTIDPNVKAIVSSGYSNAPVMANYREHGFQGVVPKPYDIGTLTNTLAQLLPG